MFGQEYEQWRTEKLSSSRYAYIWADGALGFWTALPQLYPNKDGELVAQESAA